MRHHLGNAALVDYGIAYMLDSGRQFESLKHRAILESLAAYLYYSFWQYNLLELQTAGKKAVGHNLRAFGEGETVNFQWVAESDFERIVGSLCKEATVKICCITIYGILTWLDFLLHDFFLFKGELN